MKSRDSEPPANQNSLKLDVLAECVAEGGPWPFITRRVHRVADGSLKVWSSRHHRKRLHATEAARTKARLTTLLRCLWMPGQLNWWIGTVFAVGASLFGLASVLSLAPAVARALSLDSTVINAIFFAGSIPFTTAAYLQLFQAANAGEFPEHQPSSGRRVLLGWRPQEIGWLSCALQFVGTILFNFNTFDAMIPSLTWFQEDIFIWVPNIIGSILFLTSGYLAFIETCHAHWAWKPRSLSWWVVLANLMGCLGFMISATLAMYLPGPVDNDRVALAILFTLLGAIGFFVGSLLMLPESVFESEAMGK